MLPTHCLPALDHRLQLRPFSSRARLAVSSLSSRHPITLPPSTPSDSITTRGYTCSCLLLRLPTSSRAPSSIVPTWMTLYWDTYHLGLIYPTTSSSFLYSIRSLYPSLSGKKVMPNTPRSSCSGGTRCCSSCGGIAR